MSRSGCCFLLALLPCIVLAQVPPRINGSYKAMGEMVTGFEDIPGAAIQMAFEEHYDAATGNAVFTVWEGGNNVTFVENGKTNQTLEFTNSQTCEVVTKKDWINVNAPPSLLGYNSTSGRIHFSLRHLLDLNVNYLVKPQSGISAIYRKIPVKQYMYEITGTENGRRSVISVYAYWSDPTWNTTSGRDQVPLGFAIKKILSLKGTKPNITSQYLNVFGFLKGVVDQKAFRAREGIYCKGRIHPYQLPKLPLVSSISFRSEFILPDYQEIKTMDAWYDITNGFLRIDLDRLDNQDPTEGGKTGRKYTSQITSKAIGATFRLDAFKGNMTCTVYPIDKYPFDMQEIINPKLDLKSWSIHSVIGRNTTDYVYIGKTHKRNIPCHLYQGVRKDWPEPSANIISLWEWCFSVKIESEDEAMNFRDDEVPLISASVNITQGTIEGFSNATRFIHHFYDVVNENPTNMSLATFDIQRCFPPTEKYFLQFVVNTDVTPNNIQMFQNATSDVGFLTLWKTAIAQACGTSLKSLRVTQVTAFVYADKLYVDFWLLGLHKDLPASAKKGEPSLQDASKALNKTINAGNLKITYKPSKAVITLMATKNSLREVYDKKSKYDWITLPSTTNPPITYKSLPTISFILDTTTTSSKVVTGLSSSTPATASVVTNTVPSGKTAGSTTGTFVSTTTGSPVVKPEEVKFEGHKPGTVAGVSIAMILVGISVGASGTFYKFRGLPSFLRC